MRRVIRLALTLALAAIPAFGQGTRQDGVAIRSSAGFGGATVRVCTATATGTPCSPLASIFSDRLLTVALTNPLTADVNGNYNFYAAPGRYVVQVTSGTNTFSMADVVVPPDVSGPVTFSGTLVAPTIGPSTTQQHTLPAVVSDTVALLAATQTLTNKTLTSPTATGTLTLGNGLSGSFFQINVASGTQATAGDIRLTNNHGIDWRNASNSADLALLVDTSNNLAYNGDPVATLTAAQTLTNKTLTSPTISTILNTGTLTLPTSTDTLVGKATSDTLTNKTLTSPTVNGGALSGAASAKLGAIGTPSAPTVTVNGTTGATSYTYFCVARDVNNIQTLASTGTTITNGNAVLSGSNFNAVTCGPKAGAVSYDILKTTTATLLGNVAAANAGASVTLNDTGQSTSAYTAAASDLTGSLSVPGTASFTGPGTHSGTETFDNINAVLYMGGPTYPCTQAGLTAILTAANTNGGIVNAEACSSLTVTAANTIGSATKSVTLRLPNNGTWLLSGITDGISCFFKLLNGSAILGSGMSNGGGNELTFRNNSASVNADSMICSDPATSSYVRVEGGFLLYNPSGGIYVNGLLHAQKTFDGSSFRDISITNPSGLGLYVKGACCGTIFEKIVVDGSNGTGAIPVVIDGGLGAGTDAISFINLSADHAGSGQHELEIKGGGFTGPINFYNLYVETNSGASGTTHVQLTSSQGGVNFYGAHVNVENAADTAYCFDVTSNTGNAIGMFGGRCGGPTPFNAINDHVAGVTVAASSDTTGLIPDYTTSPKVGSFWTTGPIKSANGAASMGMTLKKGSGVGNYTNATTSYIVAGTGELCYTVTIPTGWKLGISVSGELSTATAAVPAQVAITDNASCSTANAGILVETAPIQGAGIGVADSFALDWVITGDGASHNIALQFKTSNAADTASLINSSATVVPTMKFELQPSN